MRVKFTLYKKMVLLIVFVIFVSLLTAYSLILGITDTLVAQRMEIGSEKIASQITESKLVKENLMNLEKKSEVLSFVVAISESTYSNIVIFNKDKDVLFLNSPKVDQKKRFLKIGQTLKNRQQLLCLQHQNKEQESLHKVFWSFCKKSL